MNSAKKKKRRIADFNPGQDYLLDSECPTEE